MRARYIVSYDISDPKRWRKVYRTMRAYGEPLHYSVFRCDLSASEHVLLLESLTALIHHLEDRVMLIHIGPSNGRSEERMETLGRPCETGALERIAVIV